MVNFEKILYTSITNIDTDLDRVRFAKKRLRNLEYFIKNVKNDNPNITAKELKDLVHKLLVDHADEHNKIAYSLNGVTIQNLVAEYISKHEEEREKVDKIIEKNMGKQLVRPKEYKYLADLDLAIETMVYQTMQEVDELCKKKVFSEEQINVINSEYKETIKTIICAIPKVLKQELKDEYFEILINLKEYFEELDLLHEYSNLYSDNMKKIGLDALKYNVESEDPKEYTMQKFFEEGNLKSMELGELIYNSIFWENKYTKENKGILDALSIIDANDLWQDILEDKNISLSNDLIFKSMYKKEFLDLINAERIDIYMERQSNTKTVVAPLSKDIEYMEIERAVESKYMQYFSEIFGKKVSYKEDSNDTYLHSFLSQSLYTIKNALIFQALFKLKDDDKVKNWGYIPETSTIKNSKYILFGIDFEGYNLPLTVHLDKKMIVKGLMGLKEEPIIPIYYGNEDLKVNGKYLPTNVYFPLQKNQKGYIKSMLKKGKVPEETRGIVERIEALLPDKKRYLKQNELKYIDLLTGEIYSYNPNLKQKNKKMMDSNEGEEPER